MDGKSILWYYNLNKLQSLESLGHLFALKAFWLMYFFLYVET